MQRTTDMLNGRAWYLARLGEQNNHHYYYLADAADEVLAAGDDLSQLPTRLTGYAHHFVDPAIKAGLTYKIDGRNQLKVNAMAETKAPLARDAYISPRVHDRAVENIYRHDYARYYAQQYGTSWLQEYFASAPEGSGSSSRLFKAINKGRVASAKVDPDAKWATPCNRRSRYAPKNTPR